MKRARAPDSKQPARKPQPPRLCLGCDTPLGRSTKGSWCDECMSPLRRLDFPDYYCDLGEGD